MAKSPKILLFDLEISPSLGYVWQHYEANVLGYKKHWQILSVAFKWLGQKTIYCVSQRNFSEKEIVLILHDLFNKADFLIAHNGDQFDWKKSNAKFIQFGLKPPSPAVKIDTKKLAKRYFNFNSNKLDDLCELLGLGRKAKTGGFDLWLKCMAGEHRSWRIMEKYNCRDVKILERLYLKLRPWILKQPAISIVTNPDKCANCGSKKIHKRGYSIVGGCIKQRNQCQKCGGWFLSKKM